MPVLYQGVPAIWFFGGFRPGYYTPSDTPDKIDYAKLEKITRLAFLTARAAAARETRASPGTARLYNQWTAS